MTDNKLIICVTKTHRDDKCKKKKSQLRFLQAVFWVFHKAITKYKHKSFYNKSTLYKKSLLIKDRGLALTVIHTE